MSKNIYEQFVWKYIEKGMSVIPDKYMMKQPAIKAWSDYCYKKPTTMEINSWIKNIPESNIALCLGESSGIIALDVDATDQRILDIIMPILPSSPVTKIGSKGETRFFKFMNESTQILNFNGEVVLEILSNNKKTTIPPSVHPNGSAYKWVDKSLLDVDLDKLPMLPPMLITHIESVLRSELKDLVSESHGKISSGRNGALSTFCSDLIRNRIPMDEAVAKLIEHDINTNEVPLFSDSAELRNTEPFTNALQFYANHLSTINSRHFIKNEEYEIPVLYSAVTKELAEKADLGKSQQVVKEKSSKNLELPSAQSVLGSLIQNVMDNSFIKQKEFAYGAALVSFSTFIARKVVFRGISPNLYILHIAPSGCGKDAPQQLAKKWMIDIGADKLLGAGDYVSDASLIDNLQNNPVRLDIVDEASGLLKAVNASKNGFDGKMADILCELYTTSNSKFLGRALANKDGKPVIKGTCYRPNVNLLCSTTPAGFSQSVTTQALDKGLLGRFLIFMGGKYPAEALEDFPKLDPEIKTKLLWWYNYEPEQKNVDSIGTMVQDVTELDISNEANLRLKEIFKEFDNLRMSVNEDEPLLPVIARLYQQMIKIIIIHCCGRVVDKVPTINIDDVSFGYNMVKYLYQNMQKIISKYIYTSKNEMLSNKVLDIIVSAGNEGIVKSDLYNKTRSLTSKQREEMLKDLEEGGLISINMENKSNRRSMVYRSIL